MGSGVTKLVSVGTDGASGNGDSDDAVMTPDGTAVAFTSTADDLVADDTNEIVDVFVRNMTTGVTRQVSAGSLPGPYFDARTGSPLISRTGRYVAFVSSATGLVGGSTNSQVYVRDLVRNITLWASADAAGAFSGVSQGPVIAYSPVLGGDGRYIGYQATAGPIGAITNRSLVMLFDVETEDTTIVGDAATSFNAAEARAARHVG
jgi:hypothetical protein